MFNSFVNWLLHHLLFSGTLFFAAAAAPVIATEGASDSEPVADHAAGDETSGEGGDSGEESALPEGNEAVEQLDPTVKTDNKPDGRGLPPKVRELMEALKASDPQAHTVMKDILFREQAFKKEFPGGLQEAKQLREKVQNIEKDFPGGIEAVKAEQSEWRQIDEAWAKGDPKVLDVWQEANPESFNKLMPTAINKFASADPDGYQRYMSGVFLSTLQNSGVLASVKYLSRAVAAGDKEGGAELLKEITDWVGSLDAAARKAPKATDKNPELEAREKAVKQQEEDVWIKGTASELNPIKTQAIRKELKQYLKDAAGKPVELEDETLNAIELQIHTNLTQLLNSDRNFEATFTSYLKNHDREGMKKFMASKLAELLPSKVVNGKKVMGPVEKAYRLFFRDGGTKSTAKPTVKKPPVTNSNPTPKNWEKVAKAPSTNDIDFNKSPFEMRFRQAAILKNGKQVFWGANAPA